MKIVGGTLLDVWRETPNGLCAEVRLRWARDGQAMQGIFISRCSCGCMVVVGRSWFSRRGKGAVRAKRRTILAL